MQTWLQHTMIVLLLGTSSSGFAQQYFKLLEKSDQPYEQKITRFSNGDLLLGGSPLRGKVSSQNGGVNITRLDPCSNTVWSRNFQWKQNFMTFKDFAINSKDEIYVYGTTYEGNNEFVYLLKLDGKGKQIGFQMVSMGTVDNFTYNIEVHPSGAVMAYGLLLDFNTPKRGFLALFDEQLRYQWGKVFSPFESTGAAIITSDGGFLCRSGLYTFKFNNIGDLEWATLFESGEDGADFYPVAGPVAIEGGYILEALFKNEAFFYKIDERGKLLWKSDVFQTSPNAADIQTLSKNELLVVYNDPGLSENYPSILRLSITGEIRDQRRLLIEQTLQTNTIYQSISPKGLVSIIGTQELTAAAKDRHSGFLLQTVLDSSKGTCFRWQSFQSKQNNNYIVGVKNQSVSFFPLNLRNIETGVEVSTQNFDFDPSCDLTQRRTITQDSSLKCDQNWTVSLPNTDFIWEDGHPSPDRTFDTPGLYRASNYNCVAPIIYEYEVKRESCPCAVYLPTAFSPNEDGQNDQLRLYSDCPLKNVQMTVYSRWGDRLFSMEAADAQWNGFARQQPLGTGMYVVVIQYQVLNENGEVQEGVLRQNVQLLRD